MHPRVAKRSARAFGQQPAHGWRSASHWQTRACCWRRATGSTAPAGLQRHWLNELAVSPTSSPAALRAVTMVTPVANMPSALRNSREESWGAVPGQGRAGAVHKSSGAGRHQGDGTIMECHLRARAAQATRHSFCMALLPLSLSWAPVPTVLMLHDADGDYLTLPPKWRCWPAQATAPWRGTCPVMGTARRLSPTPSKAWRKAAWHSSRPCSAAPTLVGHGMGAMLALGGRAPRRSGEPLGAVRRWPGAGCPGRTGWLAPRAGAGRRAAARRACSNWRRPWCPPVHRPRRLARRRAPGRNALAQSAVPPTAAPCRHAGFDRWAQAWVNVHTPPLLVGGEADHCTPPAALEALAS